MFHFHQDHKYQIKEILRQKKKKNRKEIDKEIIEMRIYQVIINQLYKHSKQQVRNHEKIFDQ